MSDIEQSSQITQIDPQQNLKRFELRRRPWQTSITPLAALLEADYAGSGTETDPFLISWLPMDVENPQMWPERTKWILTVFAAISTLGVAFSSSAYSGAMEAIQTDLGGSEEVIILGISVFVVGFATGPVFWAPLSEAFGRRMLFLIPYAGFTIAQALSAMSTNLPALLVFRFLAGTFGSSPLTNAGGTIADCFDANQRGLAMSIFSAAPYLGPALGPILGGLTSHIAGWRWVEGFLAIFSGIVGFTGIFMMRETFAPVLLRRRASRMTKATGHFYLSITDQGKDISIKAQFKHAIFRPWLLLFKEPIVLILSFYLAVMYGTLYSLFAAVPIVFQDLRGWDEWQGGLAFLGAGLGMCSAVLYTIYDNRRYVKLGNDLPPEARLPAAMLGAPLIVFGLACFTGTDGPEVFWLIPILAGVPFGGGVVLIFIALTNYLIDAYIIYAASALAASAVIRTLVGAAFPLLAIYMYEPVGCPLASCGVHVGPAVGLILALVCLPVPFVLSRYGARVRVLCRYAAEADRCAKQLAARRNAEVEEVIPSKSMDETVASPVAESVTKEARTT